MVPRRPARVALYDPLGVQMPVRSLGPLGSIRLLIAATMARPSAASSTKRTALPDSATAQEDGPKPCSSCEITTRPALIAPFPNGVAVAEPNGGENAVAVPAPNGASTLIAHVRPAPITLVVTGHTTRPARQTRTHTA